jgi:hypothetical protein
VKQIKRFALAALALAAFAVSPLLDPLTLTLGLAGSLLACGAAVSRAGNSRQFSLSTSCYARVSTRNAARRFLTSAVTHTDSTQRSATHTQLNAQLPLPKDGREALLIRTVMAC